MLRISSIFLKKEMKNKQIKNHLFFITWIWYFYHTWWWLYGLLNINIIHIYTFFLILLFENLNVHLRHLQMKKLEIQLQHTRNCVCDERLMPPSLTSMMIAIFFKLINPEQTHRGKDFTKILIWFSSLFFFWKKSMI